MASIKVRVLSAVAAFAASVFMATSASAVPVYVGKWAVADGPLWTTNPTVLSALQTAALLFGGLPGDYSISTVDTNPLNINFMAHVDGWADSTFLTGLASQAFSLDLGVAGYAFPGGTGSAYSAYVFDHACSIIYYCAPGGGESAFNYAFKNTSAVPEPASLLLLSGGVAAAGALRRRRKVAK